MSCITEHGHCFNNHPDGFCIKCGASKLKAHAEKYGYTFFDAEQVANREYERLDPATHDFKWNADYTECYAVPLLWHDDASYAAYQLAGLGD